MKKQNLQGKTITEYKTLKMPVETTDMMDELIKHTNMGFTSRTDVVKHAVRELYMKVKELHKE
jgi:Arc/MetJ-type ribon-helix-helix transcriptional regulator